MKDYRYFFLLFTLLEITLTCLYYLVVDTINLTMIIGALLYAGGMLCAYLSFRRFQYKQKCKALIDALPS